MEVWNYEVWKCATVCGSMEIWKYRSVKVWNCGRVEVWKYGSMVLWNCGSVHVED